MGDHFPCRRIRQASNQLFGRDEMPNASERAQQRHKRDKSIIDRVARDVPEPKVPDNRRPERSPTTSTGLPVEDQVRKERDPRKGGGLPTF
jgi:hypothetical protein